VAAATAVIVICNCFIAFESSFNNFPVFVLFVLYLVDPLHLKYAVLLCLQSAHSLLKAVEVKLQAFLLPFLLLQPVELSNVCDECRNNVLSFDIVPEEPPRADLVATGWTLFLDLAIVVLDAFPTELVQTLPHVERMLVHVRAHWTQQRSLLYLLKQIQVDKLI
jgi:hypothetical protein